MLTVTPVTPHLNWINVQNPTSEETIKLVTQYQVTDEMLAYAIDPDERARVEADPRANITLLIFDVYCVPDDDAESQTAPIGIMFTNDNLITFTTEQTNFVTELLEEQVDHKSDTQHINDQIDLVLPMLYQLSTDYFAPIRQADSQRVEIQRSLERRTDRKAIAAFVNLETGLIYILTSLRGNVSLLKDLKRRSRNLTTQQTNDLDDVLIEAEQGLEMATMTSNIIERISNAYSKVLDSNLNNTMRFLTIYSIVLTIPSIVFGFFGQNVHLPFESSPIGWELTIMVMLVLAVLTMWLLMNNHWWRK
ncbi:MIT family Mg2+ and Co2+ transporter [Paucilactobacillus vaccinostercus DSM 20634]|jgi:magnesium transporter|uniref:MIT family Mg2+ and Co2+ transporter n=1 Tax=Paucilactobacillus vaccinostercus DSM 20634 TaxID=1423813 RepID=A0A0R2A5L2_9LACO|nr:magnesium transporter CorA family protein [Paucilactobacillus vaccinostercus]KRM61618.1 MIT family Mg2+ and Co2+ transporter [Paucilactobacillus vaccinostercus DSM 20634]RRG10623.1 MAG: magnesium transporter CorA family protein [Lactobacillus sp.]